MGIERIALVHHPERDDAVRARAEAERFLTSAGLHVGDEDPQLVISLGGDGTMLRAARTAVASNALLLGINMGTLGYLTEADASDALELIERVLSGEYEVDDRLILRCEAPDIEDDASLIGVNEVLVERSSRHRLVNLSVRIGGEDLADFSADGLIVATPTGSTAYALSAGGPIVAPTAECLVVVPVSAHLISFRPIVLAPDDVVEIRVGQRDEGAALSLDGGWGGPLPPQARVVVRRHERRLRLVRAGGPGFLERLRNKLSFPV